MRFAAIAALLSCGAACASLPAPRTVGLVFAKATIGTAQRISTTAAWAEGRTAAIQAHGAVTKLLLSDPRARWLSLRAFGRSLDDLAAVESEVMAEMRRRGLAPPAFSPVLVMSFPDSSRRLSLELTSESEPGTLPRQVVFLAGLAAATGDRTIAGLARVLTETGAKPGDVKRITCLYESPALVAATRAAIDSVFPSAVATLVESYRPESAPAVECEGVASVTGAATGDVRYVNLPGVAPSPFYSRAAVIGGGELIFSSMEFAAGADDAGLRGVLATVRANVATMGGDLSRIVMATNYWRTGDVRDRLRGIRPEFFGKTVPASTGVFISALANAQSPLGVEAIIAKP